ncbi:MAG: hypothetical protein IKA44_01140 [Clostridia bacterium]|nr:hypothetical protein [Clostridia bacterium]
MKRFMGNLYEAETKAGKENGLHFYRFHRWGMEKIFCGSVMEKRSECRSMTHWFSTADGKVFLQMGIEFSGGFPWWSMEKYSTFRPMEKRWKRRRKTPISLV